MQEFISPLVSNVTINISSDPDVILAFEAVTGHRG